MKYCPYCGATLLGGAASFCTECGKEIPSNPQTDIPPMETNAGATLPGLDNNWEKTAPQTSNPEPGARDRGQVKKQKKKKPDKRSKKKPTSPHKAVESEHDIPAEDDGYDGYYDDVCPVDNTHESEGLDPELIKRICMVAGGTVLIIGMAIALMLLL